MSARAQSSLRGAAHALLACTLASELAASRRASRAQRRVMPAPASVHPKICKLSARIASATLRAHRHRQHHRVRCGRCRRQFRMEDACKLVAVDYIFRRSDTLTFGGVGGASSFRERVRRDFDKVLFGINDRFGGSRRRTSAIHSRVKAESVFESRSPG